MQRNLSFLRFERAKQSCSVTYIYIYTNYSPKPIVLERVTIKLFYLGGEYSLQSIHIYGIFTYLFFSLMEKNR